MKKITLNDLVEMVAEDLEYTKKDIKDSIKCFTYVMEQLAMNSQEEELKVTIPNLGTFAVKTREARQGRNPQTGEIIDIASSKSLTFKQATHIKNLLND